MTAAFDRLVQALSARAAAAVEGLAPGADAASLRAAEERLGGPLPAELRALYARHDGERLREGAFEGVVDGVYLLSLEALCAVVAQRRAGPRAPADAEVHGPVVALTWSDGWFPFARDFGDNFVAVDLAPPPAGVPGQVVWLGFDDGRLEVLAPSLRAFLEAEAAAVESGARRLEPAAGRTVKLRLTGVAQWRPGDLVPVPGQPYSVRVMAKEATGPAARAMAAGLCVVVSHGATALSFSGARRLLAARLVDGGEEVSTGVGTAQVALSGETATCILLPAPALTASTALELELTSPG